MKTIWKLPSQTGWAVVAIASLSLVGVSAPAQATVSGSNGQIAFARQIPTGGADVFIADPDGSSPQLVPLVYPAEDFGIPVWSPDGTKLLISHTIRLDSSGNCCLPFRPAIVNTDGTGFTLLRMAYGPFDMSCPVWSLDQTRLLCAFGGDQPGVFSVRASDGGDPVRLTSNPYGTADTGGQDVPTDISPDGTRFVFVRYRPGPQRGQRPFAAEQVALFVENVDGTNLRQITPYGVAEPHEIASARWSPDGQEIISETGKGLLFVVHPDGSGRKLIQLQLGTLMYFAFEPDWSPDGTRIVFCMFIDGQEDLFTADPNGSDVVQVTHTPDFENGPDWGRASA